MFLSEYNIKIMEYFPQNLIVINNFQIWMCLQFLIVFWLLEVELHACRNN